jgi:hypothetical protein
MINGNIFFIEGQLRANFLSKNQNPIAGIYYTGAKRLFILFQWIAFTCSPLFLSAQNPMEEQHPASETEAFASAVKLYKDAFHNHTKILTGKYRNEYYKGINGHPYYDEIIWENGFVIYENQQYDSIEIKYDIYSDLLLVKYIDQEGYIRPVQLYSAKVNAFQINDHHFINVAGDSSKDHISGFFDLLLDGEIASVLAKRRKEVNQSTTLTSLENRFVIHDKLYIRIDQQYYEAKNRKSILEILSDRKSELKSFLKLNKKRFKKDQEKELIEIVKYYNSIVNNNES